MRKDKNKKINKIVVVYKLRVKYKKVVKVG